MADFSNHLSNSSSQLDKKKLASAMVNCYNPIIIVAFLAAQQHQPSIAHDR
jgi:hypothetical protein